MSGSQGFAEQNPGATVIHPPACRPAHSPPLPQVRSGLGGPGSGGVGGGEEHSAQHLGRSVRASVGTGTPAASSTPTPRAPADLTAALLVMESATRGCPAAAQRRSGDSRQACR